MNIRNVQRLVELSICLLVLGIVLGLAGCSKKAIKASSPDAVASGQTSGAAAAGGQMSGSVSSGTPQRMTEALGTELPVGNDGVLSRVEKKGEIGEVEIEILSADLSGDVGDSAKRLAQGGSGDIAIETSESDASGDSNGKGSSASDVDIEHVLDPLILAAAQPASPVGSGISAIETAAVTVPVEETFFVKEGFENIYFDFDRWAIPKPMVERLAAHASWLKAHSNSEVLVEGHCDIRGSHSFNVLDGFSCSISSQ